MTDDICRHEWGEAELCEISSHGNVHSPVCRHCGAVKFEVDLEAGRRERLALAERPINLPAALATNLPPAGKRVHPFQQQFFTDV